MAKPAWAAWISCPAVLFRRSPTIVDVSLGIVFYKLAFRLPNTPTLLADSYAKWSRRTTKVWAPDARRTETKNILDCTVDNKEPPSYSPTTTTTTPNSTSPVSTFSATPARFHSLPFSASQWALSKWRSVVPATIVPHQRPAAATNVEEASWMLWAPVRRCERVASSRERPRTVASLAPTYSRNIVVSDQYVRTKQKHSFISVVCLRVLLVDNHLHVYCCCFAHLQIQIINTIFWTCISISP